jgi:hypothetical protein
LVFSKEVNFFSIARRKGEEGRKEELVIIVHP